MFRNDCLYKILFGGLYVPPTVTDVGFGMSFASFFWGYFLGYLLTYFNKFGGFGRVAGVVIVFL